MSSDLAALERRPAPGEPRRYDFPTFERATLPNGLEVVLANVPGRPHLFAQLLVRGAAGGGASSEDAALGGATALTARAMPEGTARRGAVELVEGAERLGAELGADAGWDSLSASVEVPRSRLGPALALLGEMLLEPSFPEQEVDRLRAQRLNDIRQALADPRRRAERAFAATIYAADAAYARPLGGHEHTVKLLDRDVVAERHRWLVRPEASTLIIAGDLAGVPVDEMLADVFGSWQADGPDAAPAAEPVDRPAQGRRIVVVDRPGAPQSEIRVGHVGTPRLVDDFHALSVMNALLGGLFNSRLNRLLREERGYTYGVRSSFELRRAAGPFAVRCAVESAVTVSAIADVMAELSRIREARAQIDELDAARDYLVGVFPLRFETAAQVAGALAGLVVHGLPDDELDRYRPMIAAVSAEDVLAAAQARIDADAASIVVVGDASLFRAQLEETGRGEVEVVHDEGVASA